VSFVLFQAGNRRPPRTAARRILWGVVTLVPLGAIAAALTVGAIQGWTGEQALTESDTLWLTVWAAGMDLVFVSVLVGGVIAVTRHLAQERSTTPPS